MPITREQNAEIFDHIFSVLFHCTPGTDPIILAISEADINYIDDFISLDIDVIMNLRYTTTVDDTPVQKDLTDWRKAKIIAFLSYIRHYNIKTYEDFMHASLDNFNDYRTSTDYNPSNPFGLPPIPDAVTSTSAPTTFPQKLPASKAEKFKARIRPDLTSYIELKNNKFWDEYNRRLKAVARSQQMHEVLDPTYIPTTQEDIEIFQIQQNFMFSVFEYTLKTDHGKSVLRKYEDTGNAQKIYIELLDYAERSTKASIEASALLKYITSTKIGDGTWKGTAFNFILHWQEQVRLYECQVPQADHLSDTLK